MLSTIRTRYAAEAKDFKSIVEKKKLIKATNIWQNVREKNKKEK